MMEQQQQHQQSVGPPPPQQPPQFGGTITEVFPSSAANPTPTHPQLSSSHPSYAEMIMAAIEWDSSQGKAGGSSKRAIAKYIDRVYTNLPPTHSALLSHHLKRLKNSGNLVMIKNSYQLPVLAAATATNASAPASVAVPVRSASPRSQQQQQNLSHAHFEAVVVGGGSGGVGGSGNIPKRRPGRPPKPKVEAQPAAGVNYSNSNNNNNNNNNSSSSPMQSAGNGKRPRGRPPRQQQPAVAEVPFVQQPVSQQVYAGADSGLNNGKQVVKKRPGRPAKKQPGRPAKKQKQPHQFAQPVYEQQFEGAAQNLVAAVNGMVAKRRPGRPPGAKNLVSRPAKNVVSAPAAVPRPKGRGRPKRNALGPASKAIGKKPRGRPPRNQAAAPGVGVGVRAGGRGRGRGRPPKAIVSAAAGPTKPKTKPNPVRKYTGKPRGRPKKNALVVGTQSSELVVANEEAMKKVENMQATVRDAVGVLRPYLANENAVEVLTALQQLEDLSGMNVDASPALTEPLMTAMSVNATVQVQPSTSVHEPESESAPPEASITVPTMGQPVVPFSITAPAITETAPPLFAQPSTIDIQQPTSWMPSSEAQL